MHLLLRTPLPIKPERIVRSPEAVCCLGVLGFMKKLLAILFLPSLLFSQVVVNSGLTQIIDAPLGTAQTVNIALQNNSDEAKRVTFSLMDYYNDCDEGYVYVDGEEAIESSCRPWLTLENSELVLLPREKRDFSVLVNIPSNYNLPNANTCLFINNTALVDSVQKAGVIQFGVQIRYGVNIIYNNPSVQSSVDLFTQSLAIDTAGVDYAFELSLVNRGNASTTFHTKASIMDMEGNMVYENTSIRQSIQPQQCRKVLLENIDVAPGTYELVLLHEADSGDVFGVSESITL